MSIANGLRARGGRHDAADREEGGSGLVPEFKTLDIPVLGV
jgi:hypothetical protein